MRFIMKRISRAGGHTTDTTRNHEMTDWRAVSRFAEELSSLIRSETVGVSGNRPGPPL